MCPQPLPPSNQLFHYLFEQASLGVAVEDLEGTLLLANPALCSMLGFSENELVGMNCSQFANPEDSADDWALFQQLRAGVIDKYSLEKRYVRRDGAQLWGRLNVSLLKKGQEESSPLVFAFLEDITGRRRAEEELRQRDAELIEVQRLAGLGSWQWDAKTDQVIWSKQTHLLIGHDPNLPVPPFRERASLFTAESWDRVQRAIQEAVQTGTSYELDLEIVNPKSTAKWITTRGEPVRDAGGQITGLRGTIQDITERKRAEVALRETEQRFRLAVQAGRMYAFDWDVATDVIARSKESVHILNWEDPEHDTGREFNARVHPDDRALYDATEARLTPENPTYQISFRTLCPDGTATWLEETGRAYFDAHRKMVQVIGMVADITERKRTEQALTDVSRRLIEAQEKERTRIARELHDDIGQRLALVAVELQRLQDSSIKLPDVRSRVGELEKRISAIAVDIQSLSHQLHSAKLQYLGIASAMRGFCLEFSEQQRVEIDFNTHNLPTPLSADISLCLFRVLQEALHNSAKHSGSKHVEVRLWGATDEIHLTVRDSGEGFDLETAKTSPGLGLISMEERLKLVNGTLSIDAQSNRGTTIHARVPVSSASESMRAAG